MLSAWRWRSIRSNALQARRRSVTLHARHMSCACLSLARLKRRDLRWRRLLRKWCHLPCGSPKMPRRRPLVARVCFRGSQSPSGAYGTALSMRQPCYCWPEAILPCSSPPEQTKATRRCFSLSSIFYLSMALWCFCILRCSISAVFVGDSRCSTAIAARNSRNSGSRHWVCCSYA